MGGEGGQPGGGVGAVWRTFSRGRGPHPVAASGDEQ